MFLLSKILSYMSILAISVFMMCKNEALKKSASKALLIKCFKKVNIDKWPLLSRACEDMVLTHWALDHIKMWSDTIILD